MAPIIFKSFLSHRYKSADVNLYFFKLFKEIAEVQFEVDEGATSTNVTRLEKMIRDADAFIGIYPFPGSPEDGYSLEELKLQSRYFRLEIDLAIRSQKPAIIFYDEKYGSLLKPPGNIFSCQFDLNEITGTGGFPSLNKHIREFSNFCTAVSKKKEYDDLQDIREKNVIALLMPEYKNDNGTLDYKKNIQNLLEKYNYFDTEVIRFPVNLDNKLFRLLEKVDFAIVDHGDFVAKTGLPAYLHGKFIPMVRTEYTDINTAVGSNDLSKFLFDGLEVGYNKDKIKWDNEETLISELSKKFDILKNLKVKRINTFAAANAYFLSATLRKEVVFVSYSGKDADIAKDIIVALKNRFQTIFDYRDGTSIVPGQPWLAEIFDKLAKSAIGINLLSDSYIKSGNCIHEAQQMIANMDNGKMKLFPVKLYPEKIELPEFFGMTQYIRKDDYSNVHDLVNEIARLSVS